MEFNCFLNASIDFNSKEEAKHALKAVTADVMNSKTRSITNITLKKNVFLINIKAKDKTALRASFNSIMKPLIVFNDLVRR
jgi:tRNA threonylcarbamoyladenosine modification (KEOPS) complex  Pcc1 subunit